MKVRKAIKAIAALGAGITMVGATIMGAMAADLSEYQAPFVKNGVFDALVVVGDNAAAEDIVGGIDIGISLQYGMRQNAELGTGLASVTISEGKKIEKTGDKLNYGDDLKDIIEVLDSEDLPVILADERFQDSEGETSNEETYSQTIRLYDNTGTLVFDRNDDGDKIADSYLYFSQSSKEFAYNYTLEFDNSIDYTHTQTDTPAEDLEDTVLKIQGNDYTITDVKYNSAYRITKLTLLAGETIIWLQQGKTLTRTVSGVEHEIEVTDVNDNEDMCGVSVDGDVVWIKKGQTQTINGVQIGVTDAVAVHAQLQDVDICKVNVGATEIVLDDGKEIQVNGQDVSGTNTVIAGGDNSSAAGELDSVSWTWVPDDKEYLTEGMSLADPVFGNFEFKYAGISKKTEEITLETSNEEGTFTFTNNDGKEVDIPYYYNGSTLFLADDDYSTTTCDGRLLLEGDNCVMTTADGLDALEGVMFLLVTSGKEAHVMEVSKIKNTSSEHKVSLKDLTYGKTYDDKDHTFTGGQEISLGSLGTINLTIFGTAGSQANITATDVNLNTNGEIETKYGAYLGFNYSWSSTALAASLQTSVVTLQEESDESNALQWVLSLMYDNGTDDRLEVIAPALNRTGATGEYNQTGVSENKNNKDSKYYVTEWGTLALYDSDNDDDLTIWYPDEQVFGNAFIAPVGAVLSGSGGEVSAVTLNPINVGAAKLASEVAGQETSQNMIIVGGPCVNQAAAVVMGLDFPACGETSGIPENKAIIKLYENGDNVAMVVAGWTSEDTRRATTVVANYLDYSDKLAGTEVEVSGTSMSDIMVGTPDMTS